MTVVEDEGAPRSHVVSQRDRAETLLFVRLPVWGSASTGGFISNRIKKIFTLIIIIMVFYGMDLVKSFLSLIGRRKKGTNRSTVAPFPQRHSGVTPHRRRGEPAVREY